jgi:hypothetical protein
VKTPKSLNELISSEKETNNLSLYRQKTSKFRLIHKLLSEILGANIAQNIVVSNYKNSIVYLETTSAGIATGFKMHQSQVLSTFRKQLDPALVTVEMKVSPHSAALQSKRAKAEAPEIIKKSTKTIPAEVAKMFETIAKSSKGPLKEQFLKLSRLKQSKNENKE